MPGPCFCGTKEHLGAGHIARSSHMRWHCGPVGGVPGPILAAIVDRAQDSWAAVANITHEQVSSANQADLIISGGRIDGPLGILAETELPGPPVQRMTIDTAEAWIAPQNVATPARNGILLLNVMCHELGHAWGLQHLASGNLMQPTYDPSIESPQAGDIAAMVGMYGPPIQTPVPPRPGHDTPPSAGEPAIMIVQDAQGVTLATYEIRRVS